MNYFRELIFKQLIRRARPLLSSQGLLKTVKYKAAIVWEPGPERVLVLAPHMDDEIIGCGGAILRHFQKGADITVVYMTDGSQGSDAVNKMTGKEKKEGEDSLIATRRLEAQEALKILGIQKSIFLKGRDGGLHSSNEMQEAIREIINYVCPDVVYLPSFLEEHNDHRMTSRIFFDAAANEKGDFNCLGYEIWTPHFPNCYVRIDDVFDLKMKALACYQSQLTSKNYIHTAMGLSAYRSSALADSAARYAEAFFAAPFASYRDLQRTWNGLERGRSLNALTARSENGALAPAPRPNDLAPGIS